jgi:hypothetical protein
MQHRAGRGADGASAASKSSTTTQRSPLPHPLDPPGSSPARWMLLRPRPHPVEILPHHTGKIIRHPCSVYCRRRCSVDLIKNVWLLAGQAQPSTWQRRASPCELVWRGVGGVHGSIAGWRWAIGLPDRVNIWPSDVGHRQKRWARGLGKAVL